MKGFRLIVQKKPDGFLFDSCPTFDMTLKSLDAASALLHMIAQTCADESEISSIKLFNLDEDEKES